MATPDAQMNLYLQQIAEAVYGKDVRSAIHDGMEKSYNDSFKWADDATKIANQSAAFAQDALDTVTEATSDIELIKDIAENLESEYEETAARIDNIIAHNNDTEGNTELIDIRTTYQGTIAGSAGTAVRFQARQLNNRMDQIVRTFPTTTVPLTLTTSTTYVNLWENSSPTSSLVETEIALTDSIYAETNSFLQITYINTNVTARNNGEIRVLYPIPNTAPTYGFNARVSIPLNGDNGVDYAYRDITIDSLGTTITISNGIHVKTDNPFTLSSTNLAIVTPSATAENGGTVSSANQYVIILSIDIVQNTFSGNLSVDKDSEITDARIGADGTVYNTLGEAIRTQVAQYVDSAILDALNSSY